MAVTLHVARRLARAAVWVVVGSAVASPARAVADDEKPPKQLAAVVKLPDGKPAAGAEAMFTFEPAGAVYPNDPPEFRREDVPIARTGADGRFVLAAPAGAGAEFAGAVVHDAGFAVVYADTFPKSGVITLEPWARVEGVALRGGKPAPPEKASVATAEFEQREPGVAATVSLNHGVQPGRDGRFSLRARPGTVAVSFAVRGEPPAVHSVTRYVDAVAGKAVRVDFGNAGRPVVGKLVAPAAAQLPMGAGMVQNCTLTTRQPAPPSFERYGVVGGRPVDRGYAAQHAFESAWRDSDEGRAYYRRYVRFGFPLARDGSFRVDGVPPGEYDLRVELAPLQPSGTGGKPVLKLARAVSVPEPDAATGDAGRRAPHDLGAMEPDLLEGPGL